MIHFAQRMENTPKSFIREILKATADPEVISFAGGLPNPEFFPVEGIAQATQALLTEDGAAALQYSTTEGHPPLRRYIAERYRRKYGLDVSPDDILITNGSQQGLDLIGKILLDAGDHLLIERPGYLGAIQAFSLYQPVFHMIPLQTDGIDLPQLERALDSHPIKLFYSVPNFQNPSGITYSRAKREAVAALLQDRETILVEDDPYGELRFTGEFQPSFRHYLHDNLMMLGSFSKVVAPGLRLGWIVAPPPLMDKLIIAKQASDLHSNYFSQRVLARFLQDNDLDRHLLTIKAVYKKQCELMVSMLEECFPPEIKFTRPEGGMFVWVTLPDNVSVMELFEEAARRKVMFVPGQPFYVDGGGNHTLRLNFSNADEANIETGMQRLAEAVRSVMVR